MAQNDVLKRYLDAGLAFTALTQARAEALVKDLVKAGEVQADQAREAVSDLIERSRSNSERLLETVRTEVRAQLSERGVASKSDLDKLEARVSELLGAAARSARAATERVGSRTSAARKAATKSADPAEASATSAAKKGTASAKKATKTTAKKSSASAKKATKKASGRTTSTAKATPARKSAAKKRA